jgi:hypothetical protein
MSFVFRAERPAGHDFMSMRPGDRAHIDPEFDVPERRHCTPAMLRTSLDCADG